MIGKNRVRHGAGDLYFLGCQYSLLLLLLISFLRMCTAVFPSLIDACGILLYPGDDVERRRYRSPDQFRDCCCFASWRSLVDVERTEHGRSKLTTP
jgi:hypothetical protein